MTKRTRYSAEFKARVALDAMHEELALAELSKKHGVQPAMDNRMIERLWRSLKYECVYIRAFETGSEALPEIGKWLTYYNTERPHSRHGILTPDETYERNMKPRRQAA